MFKIGLGSVVLSVEDHGLCNVDLVSFIGSAFCTEGLIFLGGKLSHTDYQLKQHEENHTWGWSSLQNLIHVECEFSAPGERRRAATTRSMVCM